MIKGTFSGQTGLTGTIDDHFPLVEREVFNIQKEELDHHPVGYQEQETDEPGNDHELIRHQLLMRNRGKDEVKEDKGAAAQQYGEKYPEGILRAGIADNTGIGFYIVKGNEVKKTKQQDIAAELDII